MTADPQSIPTYSIASPSLRAEISQRGAELVRLQDEGGRDLLWDGIDLGHLSESWRVERDTPAYGTRMTADELRHLTHDVERVIQS